MVLLSLRPQGHHPETFSVLAGHDIVRTFGEKDGIAR